MKTVASLAIVLAAGSSALAVVIPNDRAAVAGNGSFLSPLAASARSYQMIVHADELAGVLGQQINGLAFRLLPSAGAPLPAADMTWSDYDIYLSDAVDPSARTTVFANNIVGAVTQVRSGSYTLTAGSLPSGGSPNAFGPHIAFDSPYLYSGGNLSILIRHNGATGSNISTDAVTLASGPASGYGVRFGATWGSGYTSTGSSNGNFAIIDLSVVPAPASGALLGLALLGAARRRR